MRRLLAFITILAINILAGITASAQDHPRILIDNALMEQIRSRATSGDAVLRLLHQETMSMADEALEQPALSFRKDESGRRILQVSRDALRRISSCAYAFRFTSSEKYLEQVRKDLASICSFQDWNPSHFLDVAEMSLAAAVGYDWTYNSLSEEERTMISDAIMQKALIPAQDTTQWWISSISNWNQVCNAGILIATMSIMDPSSEQAMKAANDAKFSNIPTMRSSYSPDGNYPEGPSYWNYGTTYEALMLTVMEDLLGSDLGLSRMEGFLDSGRYESMCYGPEGDLFNYGDSNSREASASALWYFAWKNSNPGLLFHELSLLSRRKIRDNDSERFLPFVLAYAARMPRMSLGEKLGNEGFFTGHGDAPVVLVSKSRGSKTFYLGVKGGSAGYTHSHMDAGSFVYDACGYRWSMDPDKPSYAPLEAELAAKGGDLWDLTQESMRWQLPYFNNRQHSTLTINGKDHNVKGFASIVSSMEKDGDHIAVLDMSGIFEGEVRSVNRTFTLKADGNLMITDVVTALPGKDAEIRWSMMTPATISVGARGIVLTQGNGRLDITTTAKAKYRQWKTDGDYGCCGFTTTVKAGQTAIFTTVLLPY